MEHRLPLETIWMVPRNDMNGSAKRNHSPRLPIRIAEICCLFYKCFRHLGRFLSKRLAFCYFLFIFVAYYPKTMGKDTRHVLIDNIETNMNNKYDIFISYKRKSRPAANCQSWSRSNMMLLRYSFMSPLAIQWSIKVDS